MMEKQELWVAGEGGYHTYRIPALCVTTKGTVLAFCEGRKHSGRDAGEIDVLVRRSEDGGTTWGTAALVARDPGMTVGNPAPVVDASTGTIWLLLCKNPAEGGESRIRKGEAERTVWVTRSEEDGMTWAQSVEISADVKRKGWTWYATGPGHGVQLASGRMIIACDHRAAPSGERGEAMYSHAIYSDDHGKTWRIGGLVPEEGSNESAVVELEDGSVYLNCRDQHKRGRRCGAWSRDGGETFGEHRWDDGLVEPACQGSLERITGTDGRVSVLFCNPASATRDTLTVKVSHDGCRSWSAGRVLEARRAAYSDLAVLADETVLCLYERGENGPYERLTLARFDAGWVEGRERTNGAEER
ncbi:MAG: sialidase family protein [Chloroflexota bacterium]